MSIGYNPQPVKDGLIFAYDMDSPSSWKGKPTTNQMVNGTNLQLSGWTFNASYASANYKFNETTHVGNTSYFLQNSSVTVGLNYAMSFEAKAAERTFIQIFPSTGFSTVNWCDFDLTNGTYQVTGTGTASIESTGNGWWKCSFTVPATATTGSGRFAVCTALNLGDSRNAAHDGIDGYGLYVKNIQFEQQDYATPFVDGTRSNTEALIDWKGRHTITATTAYTSDNKFIWDATGDQRMESISSDFTVGTSDFTMEFWVKYVSAPSYLHIGVLGTQAAGMCLKAYRDGLGKDGKVYLFGGGGTYNSDSTIPLYLDLTGKHTHIVVSRISGTMYMYKNGELAGSYSNPYSVASTNFTIGDGVSVSEYSSKEIPIAKLYNRGLSAAEVKQNFRALKGRFGI